MQSQALIHCVASQAKVCHAPSASQALPQHRAALSRGRGRRAGMDSVRAPDSSACIAARRRRRGCRRMAPTLSVAARGVAASEREQISRPQIAPSARGHQQRNLKGRCNPLRERKTIVRTLRARASAPLSRARAQMQRYLIVALQMTGDPVRHTAVIVLPSLVPAVRPCRMVRGAPPARVRAAVLPWQRHARAGREATS
jgi:hypothetical protein